MDFMASLNSPTRSCPFSGHSMKTAKHLLLMGKKSELKMERPKSLQAQSTARVEVFQTQLHQMNSNCQGDGYQIFTF